MICRTTANKQPNPVDVPPPAPVDVPPPEPEPEPDSDDKAIILQHLADAPDQTAMTGELVDVCQRKRATFSTTTRHEALAELQEEGKISRLKRGFYQLC